MKNCFTLKRILYFLIVSVLCVSCNKLEEYDDRPIIIESSYTLLKNELGKDTSLVLKFTFTDGDGNVGLEPKDTVPPNNTNVKIDYFEKIDGEFTKILIPGTTDTLNFNSIIKKFGSNNPTKAEVEINIDIKILLADTVRFDYYIVDKALNKSNKVTTGIIELTN